MKPRSALCGLLPAFLAAAPYAQCERGPLLVPGSPDTFGFAIDALDDRVLVGAPTSSSPPGAAYVFRREPGDGPTPLDDAFVLEEVLAPRPTTSGLSEFGRTVALGEDVALVAAPGFPFTDGTPGAGEVHVFYRQGTAWSAGPVLTVETDGEEILGTSLSLCGSTLAVGSRHDYDPSPGAFDPGSVYLFERLPGVAPLDPSDDAWVLTTRLQPSAADPADPVFGLSTALMEDHLLVGSPHSDTYQISGGEVFAYARDAAGTPGDPLDDTWVLTQRIVDPDGAPHRFFGFSLDGSGAEAVVGSPGFVLNPEGSATTLRRDDAGTADPLDDLWSTVARLEIPSPIPSEPVAIGFGGDVALLGDRIAVSTSSNEPAVPVIPSSAYLFGRPSAGSDAWVELAAFEPPDLTIFDRVSMAIGPDFAFLGTTGQARVRPYLTPSAAWIAPSAQELSTSAGASTDLELAACPSHDGDLYWVLGSITGTAPGFGVGGLTVPLLPDVYLGQTIYQPNAGVLEDSLSLLDEKSSATARFTVPADKPALVGLEVHHAALILSDFLGSFVQVTNATTATIVP